MLGGWARGLGGTPCRCGEDRGERALSDGGVALEIKRARRESFRRKGGSAELDMWVALLGKISIRQCRQDDESRRR